MMLRSSLLPLGLLIVGIVLIVLGACAPLYIPTASHVPTFDSTGEVQAAAYIGLSGYDAQLAWSPYDGLALSGAFSYAPKDDSAVLGVDHSHLYGELLGGYSGRLGKAFRFNLLAGYGSGHATYRDFSYDSTSPPPSWSDIGADFDRLMVQAYIEHQAQWRDPSDGRIRRNVGLAGRLVRAGFRRLVRDDAPLPNHEATVLECIAILKFGSPLIQFEGQTGPVFVLDGAAPELGIKSWWTFNAGLRIRFDPF
jgi:hypothetical protein